MQVFSLSWNCVNDGVIIKASVATEIGVMSNTASFVPESEGDLSREWLEVALATTHPEAVFTSLTCTRIGESFGFASRIFRCQWYEKTSVQSVVVKLWSTDSKAGVGEVNFYNAFQDIGIRTPRCYFSAVDELNNRAVLILEDLKDATQGDCLEQLDLVRATNISLMLARLHGKWLENSRLAELSWLPGVSRWEPDNDWFSSRRTEFLERFDAHIVGLPRQILEKIERAPKVVHDRLSSASATLLHDDFHLDNILFENKTEPVLLDWSNPVVGPSANNLIDLIVFMSSLDDFDAIFKQYLNEYNRVSNHPQSEQELNSQLGGALLHRFSRVTCGAARWYPTSARGSQLITAGIAIACRAVMFWNERDPELFSFARRCHPCASDWSDLHQA